MQKSRCSVAECRISMSSHPTTHHFPKDIFFRKIWLERSGLCDSEFIYLCGHHFDVSQYRTARRKRLINGAIPSLCLPKEYPEPRNKFTFLSKEMHNNFPVLKKMEDMKQEEITQAELLTAKCYPEIQNKNIEKFTQSANFSFKSSKNPADFQEQSYSSPSQIKSHYKSKLEKEIGEIVSSKGKDLKYAVMKNADESQGRLVQIDFSKTKFFEGSSHNIIDSPNITDEENNAINYNETNEMVEKVPFEIDTSVKIVNNTKLIDRVKPYLKNQYLDLKNMMNKRNTFGNLIAANKTFMDKLVKNSDLSTNSTELQPQFVYIPGEGNVPVYLVSLNVPFLGVLTYAITLAYDNNPIGIIPIATNYVPEFGGNVTPNPLQASSPTQHISAQSDIVPNNSNDTSLFQPVQIITNLSSGNSRTNESTRDPKGFIILSSQRNSILSRTNIQNPDPSSSGNSTSLNKAPKTKKKISSSGNSTSLNKAPKTKKKISSSGNSTSLNKAPKKKKKISSTGNSTSLNKAPKKRKKINIPMKSCPLKKSNSKTKPLVFLKSITKPVSSSGQPAITLSSLKKLSPINGTVKNYIVCKKSFNSLNKLECDGEIVKTDTKKIFPP